MSENNSNPTVDDNIAKDKELLMGDNAHNVGNYDNEAQVSHQSEEIKEDKDKLVDINVNEIQDFENKTEQASVVDDEKDLALVNQNSKEDENKDNGSSLEKPVDDIPDETKLASIEADQIVNYISEQDDNSQAMQIVTEESKNVFDNAEFTTNNENTQIEKTEAEKVSTSEEIEKDLSEKQSNENEKDTISTEHSLIEDNPQSQNDESNQEINNSNLLNLTSDGVEDETMLIRGLAASEEADKLSGHKQISVEENISSCNQPPSPTEELSDAITSTPLTTSQQQLLADPFSESQQSEELTNVDSLAEGQYLSTTEDDKSLNAGAVELIASQPEEPLSQPVEHLSSRTEELVSTQSDELASTQSEEHLVQKSEEFHETSSEEKVANLSQEPHERIISNEDRSDSVEKSTANASQDDRFEFSSTETQEIREEDQSSNAFSQNLTANEENNMFKEESNVLVDVNEESIPKDTQNQSLPDQREEVVLDDDLKIEVAPEINQFAEDEKNKILEEKLSENTNLEVSDSVTEEVLIPSEIENSSTNKFSSDEKDEENIDTANEFSRENINDPEPVVEEYSKNQVELEESMPQSYETNEFEDFVEVEESKLLASSPQEEIMNNLENEERFECYEETEEVASHYSEVSANPDKKLNSETRLMDSEQVDTNIGVSENLLEYTEEVASNILQSSREEIARKSTTRNFWSKEYQEFLKKNLSSLPSIIFFSFIFISGVLGSALEMSIIPFALFNVVAFLSIFLIYKCFLSC